MPAYLRGLFALFVLLTLAGPAAAEKPRHGGNEANLKLPDLNQARFLGDRIGGRDLLYTGLVVLRSGWHSGW